MILMQSRLACINIREKNIIKNRLIFEKIASRTSQKRSLISLYQISNLWTSLFENGPMHRQTDTFTNRFTEDHVKFCLCFTIYIYIQCKLLKILIIYILKHLSLLLQFYTETNYVSVCNVHFVFRTHFYKNSQHNAYLSQVSKNKHTYSYNSL